MKRRSFIKHTGAAISLPLLVNGLPIAAMGRPKAFSGINEENDRVLVLVQLNGGCDGLNTLIPLDQYDALSQVRGNILIPEEKVLKLTNETGLHPSMIGLQNLYAEEKVNFIQSVSYPNQNRSHFRSKDIWLTGSPADEFWTTGWLGRYFYDKNPDFPENYPNSEYPHPFAITLGNVVSETCQGPAANYSMTLTDPFSLSPLAEAEGDEVPNTPYGEELKFLRISIAQTNDYSETISEAAGNGSNMVDYPENNRLAEQMRTVALLIAGGLKTKVYVVSMGGFDTHANQVVGEDTATGEQAELLNTLSEAIAAFQADLKALNLEEQVVGLAFTEFGRRIRSNDSLGTDHGTAAPLIAFGSCVNAAILGDNPEIAPDVGKSEGVPMQFDFRDAYGSILMDWFDLEEDKVKGVLHEDFQYLPILKVCARTTDIYHPHFSDPVKIHNYPNPFKDWTRIVFESKNEWVRLSIFDQLGAEIKTLVNQRLPEGEHQIAFDGSSLPAGSYFYRLQLEGRQKTKRMVKAR